MTQEPASSPPRAGWRHGLLRRLGLTRNPAAHAAGPLQLPPSTGHPAGFRPRPPPRPPQWGAADRPELLLDGCLPFEADGELFPGETGR